MIILPRGAPRSPAAEPLPVLLSPQVRQQVVVAGAVAQQPCSAQTQPL